MNYDRVIEVVVRSSNPELLAGLDLWLHLGLVSDAQVKKIAYQCLCCPLPEPILPEEILATPKEENREIALLTKVNIAASIWQSLRDELSVRWLLFLGVFLVVLSSGVLAATQWQNFPPFAQYTVLWGYTIVFWLVGLWLGRQENLQITSRTLQNISLLLIPINFWAIDGFRLGGNLVNLLTIGIAFITLTAMAFWWSRLRECNYVYIVAFLVLSYLHWQLTNYSLVAVYLGTIGATVSLCFDIWRRRDRSISFGKKTGKGLVIFALAVLLVRSIFILHVSIFDLGLAIALCGWLVATLANSSENFVTENTDNSIDPDAANNSLASTSTNATDGEETAIEIEEDEDLSRSFPSQVLARIGIGLIFLGWLIPFAKLSLYSWGTTGNSWFIIQSSIAGILGFYFYWRELQISWRRRDLILLFFIGLQELLLLKELIPIQLRQGFSTTAVTISQAQNYPYSIYGVTGYIYVIAWVSIANWLQRKERYELAKTAEYILLVFGILLFYLTLYNPACRSINLILSSLTLAYFVTHRRPYRTNLIDFTHTVSWLTLFSCLNWWLPNLSQLAWGYVFLVIAIVEWGMSIFGVYPENAPVNDSYRRIWCANSWYFGFIFASISHLFLLTKINIVVDFLNISNNSATKIAYIVLPWLLIPITLTAVASYTPQYRRIEAATSSCIALVISQSLTIWHSETRFIGLAVACGLMLVNTRYLLNTNRERQQEERQREMSIDGEVNSNEVNLPLDIFITASQAALLHIAFCLSFFVALLWETINAETITYWSIATSVSTLVLWVLRAYLETKGTNITYLYANAANRWSKFLLYSYLTVFTFFYITFNFYRLDIPINTPHPFGSWYDLVKAIFILAVFSGFIYQGAIASTIFIFAVLFRYYNKIDSRAIYTLAWLVAIVLCQINFASGGNGLTLAIANVILAFIILLSIDRFRSHSLYPILQTLPPIYAALAIFWRIDEFNSLTGCLTLAAAIVGIGVAKANFFNGKLTYLSLTFITLGIYEIVIYQMLQATGGSAADGFTVLAAVTASIALIYRIFAWRRRKRNIQSVGEGRDRDAERGRRGEEEIFETRSRELTRVPLASSLNLDTIIICAHIHWAIASFLKIVTAGIALEKTGNAPQLSYLSIGISILLGLYAIVQGRDSQSDADNPKTDWWVYVGMVEITATLVYARFLWKQLSIIDPWRILLISIVALIIYQLPWQSWGWQKKSWHRISLLAPLISAIVTPYDISSFSLLIVAAFYGRIAYQQKNIRWSYLSLAFLDWAVLRFFTEKQIQDPLWYAIVFGVSLLYIAQVDRDFLLSSQRQNRHNLRIFGSGIICVFALILHQESIWIPCITSFFFIFAGLGLRIRAFLYVGTISFMLTAFYQLVILVFSYSFLKWVIGLGTGILLISIAANFERRREQILQLFQSWFTQLREWQ